MYFSAATVAAFAASTAAYAIPAKRDSGISITPHDKYSSSVGVLGCKIDTNRVAYWPSSVDCDKVCVKVSANGRSVNLLKIDTSGGAYDISYDAWNYLNTGEGAEENPTMGGGIPATYEDVDMSECEDLLKTDDKSLAFTAANAMNFVSSCKASDSWVGNNFSLFNIANSACTLGEDERCEYPDLSKGNQPTCPHQLGIQTPMEGEAVQDISYGTGKTVKALQ
ncbi:hypothetical protein WHR41_01796 [Cladosporium halotolerans]|uniref:Cerato-platanin n=1 Tax=Cladosporium halotolerans TaxID=1052096 RepID=A0AB34L168_9PEZI